MCTCQKLLAAQTDRNGTILNDREKIISGVHQRSEQQIIKIIVSFVGRRNLLCDKSNLLLMRKKNPRRLRAGERKRILTQSLKFFNVTRVFAAGITEHILARLTVQITEVFFIQKCTAMLILAKSLLLPVNIIVKPVSERASESSIFLQTFVINHNLPPCTARVRTGTCNAGKFFIKNRSGNLHIYLLLFDLN